MNLAIGLDEIISGTPFSQEAQPYVIYLYVGTIETLSYKPGRNVHLYTHGQFMGMAIDICGHGLTNFVCALLLLAPPPSPQDSVVILCNVS